MKRVCEYCGNKFDSGKEFEKHFIKCKWSFENKLEKIFIKKGKVFLNAGATLFFIGLGLIFLFGFNFVFRIFLFLACAIIAAGFGLNLRCNDIKFKCKTCDKKFKKINTAMKHLKFCGG